MAFKFKSLIRAESGLLIPTGAAAGKVLTSDGSGNATWEVSASPQRVSHTFAISGTIAVASGDTDFINPMFASVAAGRTCKLIKALYRINTASSSVTFKLRKNGSDISGFTGLVATNTTASVTPDPVTILDEDMLVPFVTLTSGTPKNLSLTMVLEYT